MNMVKLTVPPSSSSRHSLLQSLRSLSKDPNDGHFTILIVLVPPSDPFLTTDAIFKSSRWASTRYTVTPHSTESVDAYRPVGYHPVHIGELLHDGRYQIIHKLDSGSFSTVWLARDFSYVRGFLPLFHLPDLPPELCASVASLTFSPLAAFYNRSSRNVAVKIKTVKNSIRDSELSILSGLRHKTGFSDTGAAHVISLLDSFVLQVLQGPNGQHLCLVFEALGQCVSPMLEFTPGYRRETPRGFVSCRFPLWMAKRILRHILLGISNLHSNGVIHETYILATCYS